MSATPYEAFHRADWVTRFQATSETVDARLRELAEGYDRAPCHSRDLAVYRGSDLVALVRKNNMGSVQVVKTINAPRRWNRPAEV
jgi:hypothetical protein